MMPVQDQITLMQIRLLRLACARWRKSQIACADFFSKNKLYAFIRDNWDGFHIQGDEACLNDIEEMLKHRGIRYDAEP